MERAHKNFFAKRADRPRFKRKGDAQCSRHPDAKQVEIDQFNSRIKLPKLKWIRYRNSRDILGVAKNTTVSQSVGKSLASIQTEGEMGQPLPTSPTAVGIDGGVARFATLSDGDCIDRSIVAAARQLEGEFSDVAVDRNQQIYQTVRNPSDEYQHIPPVPVDASVHPE
ncbi:transposase [Limnohabitans sp. Rim8]|uniref:transposase n=1 Tax=Limnohabitans sp. Rim8 TaxID=1100718 RepID=UPI003305D192